MISAKPSVSFGVDLTSYQNIGLDEFQVMLRQVVKMGKRFTDWELDILFFKKTLLNV